jgi:homoserine trans-succinylase
MQKGFTYFLLSWKETIKLSVPGTEPYVHKLFITYCMFQSGYSQHHWIGFSIFRFPTEKWNMVYKAYWYETTLWYSFMELSRSHIVMSLAVCYKIICVLHIFILFQSYYRERESREGVYTNIRLGLWACKPRLNFVFVSTWVKVMHWVYVHIKEDEVWEVCL